MPRPRNRAVKLTLIASSAVLAVGAGVGVERAVTSHPDAQASAAGRSSTKTMTVADRNPAPKGPGGGGSASATRTRPETGPALKPLRAGSGSGTGTSGTGGSFAPTAPDADELSAPLVPNAGEKAVLRITNRRRARAGCRPLRYDRRLFLAAKRHSVDMAVHNYFSHNSRDGSSPWDRIRRAGYRQPGAENIAKGYPTPAAVMAGWMNSPGHRANILNCGLKAIGIGRANGRGGPLWTQDFGWV